MANTKVHPELDLVEEYRRIKEALQRSKYREQFDLRFEPIVRLEGLEESLLVNQPNIVHLACYGNERGEEGMLIQDKDDEPKMISSGFLSNLFKNVNSDRNIRCVLLNTCNCKRTTEAIAKHVPCVIGQEALISDEDAMEFASTFYLALGSGRSVNDAFELAREKLQAVHAAMPMQEEQKIVSSPVLNFSPGVDLSTEVLTKMSRRR